MLYVEITWSRGLIWPHSCCKNERKCTLSLRRAGNLWLFLTRRKMKELLIRMVYVEMLGHDASFGHIHAIKMSKSGTLAQRRVGYLCCSLCLHSEHELMLLLVGGLQTDLQSDNHLEVSLLGGILLCSLFASKLS